MNINNTTNTGKKVHDADLLDPFGYPVYEEEYNAAHGLSTKNGEDTSQNERLDNKSDNAQGEQGF